VLAVAEGLGLPTRHGRALDFGCGVGRLTRALAPRFERVVGLDISEPMLERARAACEGLDNVSFELNLASDLARLDDGSFDLVLSLITLQHVSDRGALESYIRELVRVLAPGGVAIFQLPTRVPPRSRLNPRRQAYRLLRAIGLSELRLYRLGLYSMKLNAVPQTRIGELVADAGGKLALAQPDTRAGSAAIPSVTYFAVPA
jgi:SAM-dependent methyltransferase